MANGNSPFYPNRLRIQFTESTTEWRIMATDGVGYASYQALLDAGKKPYPGDNNDFPRGIPNTLVRSIASGMTAGGPFIVETNTTAKPPDSNAVIDTQVGGTDQQFGYEHANVRQLWLRKGTAGDTINIFGMF